MGDSFIHYLGRKPVNLYVMKKLKGLASRAYNSMFHTHTVAGIVISFALFVIFYAGAFSLFRHEIIQWENPDMRQPVVEDMDFDAVLERIDSAYQLNFHQVTNVNFPSEKHPVVSVYGAYNDTDSTTQRMAAYISPKDGRIQDLNNPLTTVGDTIYYLHYFRQIPAIGLYLAGLVALFFLFAIVTGILIHWRNLLTKFYAFTIEGKWKNIWTNAHTVLGVIGLPFQLMYAVTGAFFGLLTLILLPTVILLYQGDTTKIFAKVQPQQAIQVAKDAPKANHLSLSELANKIKTSYPNHEIKRAQLRNYGRADAVVTWQLDDDKTITAPGVISMNMSDGKVLAAYSILPDKKTYRSSVTDFIFKLHFANFGSISLRVIYFILSMITCFMIISGVLIWRTARNNNRYTAKQKLFHHRVTKVYLAICLSMFPAFAMLFIANKTVPMEMVGRAALVNAIFFVFWLAITIAGLFWNNYAQQNRNYLILGGFLALLIPIANGIVTGGWVWTTIVSYPSVAYVDLFWLMAGLTSLYLSFYQLKAAPSSNPQIKQDIKIPAPEMSNA